MTVKLYALFARTIQARTTCARTSNEEWFERHTETLERLARDHMPSGRGFDCGTKLDLDQSNPEKLVFDTSYHHMNEAGFYDGWTEHSVIITPSLGFGFDMRITGRDRNDIKEYISDTFNAALSVDMVADKAAECWKPAA